MVEWHPWLNGHEFNQAQEDSEGQESLACCSSWSHKVRHDLTTEHCKLYFLHFTSQNTLFFSYYALVFIIIHNLSVYFFNISPLLSRTVKSLFWLFSLLRHPMCGWGLSSPCLLTRLSGSSDSWPRSKNRIVPFLNEFEWKLAIKLGTTRREDIGEEPSWVYKKSHIKSGTRVKTTYLSSRITVRTSLL